MDSDVDFVMRVLIALTTTYAIRLQKLADIFKISAADLQAFIDGRGTLTPRQIAQIMAIGRWEIDN